MIIITFDQLIITSINRFIHNCIKIMIYQGNNEILYKNSRCRISIYIYPLTVIIGLMRSEKTFSMSTPKHPGAQIFRFTQVKLMIDPLPPSHLKLPEHRVNSAFQCDQ